MRRLTLLAILTLLAATPAAPATAQTLRVGLPSDPDMLDPTLSNTFPGRVVFTALCDRLFDLDAKLSIVPQLATGYDWPDPTSLVIHLRQGVTFQDGEPLDAAAVAASLDRHLTFPRSARRSEIGDLARIDILDPATLRLTLKAPSAPFLAQLTDRAGMILAPEAAKQAGADFGLHPVCAGPFRFTERVAQDHITLDRFPGYWDAGSIHFDRVIYRPMPDGAVKRANLQAGALDIADEISPADVDAIRADPKLRLVVGDGLGYVGITANLANGPRGQTPFGQDARVRQAFALSIDRAALTQVVFQGMFTPTAQAISPSSPYYDPATQPAPRDVARARALLRAAGVKLPYTLNFLAVNAPDTRQAAEVIQSMAAEAGFDVKITLIEATAQVATVASGDFEAALYPWSGRPDPDGNLYSMLHGGAASNYGHYSSPAVDSLLDDARRTADIPARRALYAKLAARETQYLPIIYLWSRRNIVAMTTKLTGYTPVPDGMIRLQGLSLEK